MFSKFHHRSSQNREKIPMGRTQSLIEFRWTFSNNDVGQRLICLKHYTSDLRTPPSGHRSLEEGSVGLRHFMSTTFVEAYGDGLEAPHGQRRG